MTPRRLRTFFLACFALFVWLPAPAVAAAAVRCSLGEIERVIEVTPAEPGSVPCEVRYRKGARDRALWRAERERRFCEDRADALRVSLLRAGWTCDQATPSADPSVAPTPALPAVSAPPPRPEPSATFVIEPEDKSTPRTHTAPIWPRAADLVRDPRLRFYERSLGAPALERALRLVRIDLNRDGREELFLRVDHPEACGGAACPWDLFQIGDEGELQNLGVQGVVAWRILNRERRTYPDLAVRFARGEERYAVYRFSWGLYREAVGGEEAAEVFRRTEAAADHARRD